MFEITDTIQNETVSFSNPPKEFFQAIGGIEGMQRFMYNFYDKIYESEIAHFFPQDEEEFEEVKKKNTAFFTQICGGSTVYDAKDNLNEYMIGFHKDFSIDEKARIEWLSIMAETLEELDIDRSLKEAFWKYVEALSKLMVNRFNKKDPFIEAY